MNQPKTILLLTLLWILSSGFVPGGSYPDNTDDVLFKIARSRDANEIWYRPNFNSNGLLDSSVPINAFWVKKTEANLTEPLTWIQNRYAYGIKLIKTDKNENVYYFRFVSYEKQIFELRKTGNGYKAYTTINNKKIKLEKIFVQIDGGSFWFPKVPFVKITGTEIKSGHKIIKKILP